MLRDAYPFLIPLGILAALCLVLGWIFGSGFYIAAALLLALALFIAFFFRDPDRVVPAGEDLVVSPADGLVVVVRELDNDEKGTLVSIFLSIFDVHVNRSPIAGKIVAADYRPGKFLVATKQKASIENEQNVVTVENASVKIVYKQIAGLIARRIVFWNKVGDHVQAGQRIGLIKFGSRVDVIMPPSVKVAVKKGQRVKGGVSVIGKVNL